MGWRQKQRIKLGAGGGKDRRRAGGREEKRRADYWRQADCYELKYELLQQRQRAVACTVAIFRE